LNYTDWKIFALLASLCVAPCSQLYAQSLVPISFLPANPVAGQAVVASLQSITICGTPSVSISGSSIAIINTAIPPCKSYPSLSVSLGALAAGTYQVTWSQTTDTVPAPGPFAASALVVGAAGVASAPAPALTLLAELLLAAGFGVIGVLMIGSRPDLKKQG
jgi:hypothetical protein